MTSWGKSYEPFLFVFLFFDMITFLVRFCTFFFRVVLFPFFGPVVLSSAWLLPSLSADISPGAAHAVLRSARERAPRRLAPLGRRLEKQRGEGDIRRKGGKREGEGETRTDFDTNIYS